MISISHRPLACSVIVLLSAQYSASHMLSHRPPVCSVIGLLCAQSSASRLLSNPSHRPLVCLVTTSFVALVDQGRRSVTPGSLYLDTSEDENNTNNKAVVEKSDIIEISDKNATIDVTLASKENDPFNTFLPFIIGGERVESFAKLSTITKN
jgi:hypothetical protein